ncbi:MAG: hypothetical protein PHC34_07395 [Candidatus Gastranaerophilales bacterium]|nr:hypothetical protein [Candidatus Gastranaerophilales bacterium]
MSLFGGLIDSVITLKGPKNRTVTSGQGLVNAAKYNSQVWAQDWNEFSNDIFHENSYFATEKSDDILMQREGQTNSIYSYNYNDRDNISEITDRRSIYDKLDGMDGEQDGLILHKDCSVFNLRRDEFVNNNYSLQFGQDTFEIKDQNGNIVDSYDSKPVASASSTSNSSTSNSSTSNSSTSNSSTSESAWKTLMENIDPNLKTNDGVVSLAELATLKGTKFNDLIEKATGYTMEQFDKVVGYANDYINGCPEKGISSHADWSCFENDLAANFGARPEGAAYTQHFRENKNGNGATV